LAGINPLARINGVLTIWGHKTLQLKASQTDRLAVRRLLIYVEQATAGAIKYLVFKPGNKTTWEALKRMVGPFLSDLQGRDAFYAAFVQCDATINTPTVVDNHQMLARVFVKPVPTAEYITVDWVITGSGANFAEIFAK
jgi:phage tail sheath protein FI